MTRKILFIEDDPTFAEEVNDYMRTFEPQFNVLEVSTWNDAVDALGSSPPFDIVICDLMIGPGTDSFREETLNSTALEFIRSLRSEGLYSNVPIVTVTSRSEFDQEAIAAGADLCLRKPFAVKELNDVVQSILIREDLKKQRRPVLVAHVFTASEIDDLRRAVSEAFKDTPFSPYYSDVEVREGHILLDKIVDKIRNTEFGIYDISVTERPNVFLELGISIGLGKPYYLIVRSGTEVPSDLAGLDRIEYASHSQLTTHIRTKIVAPRLSR